MPTATNRGDTPDKSEMKACPFCKSAAMALKDWQGFWAVRCNNDGTLGKEVVPCNAAGPERPTEAEAIAAWNTRTPSRPPADQVPDMVEAACVAFFDKMCAYIVTKPDRFGEPKGEVDFYSADVPEEDREAFRDAIRAAIAALQAAPQVPDMVERVFAAIQREAAPGNKNFSEREIKSGVSAALQAVPAASEVGEELGDCELCSKPLALGQFVNVYDDIGTAHANCEQPFAKPSGPTPAPGDDGTTMPTFVLLGEPALLETVEERLLTATEEAELVERINANPNLQSLPEQPALKASGEE